MGRPTEVRVRVPASSANLGPGFDSLGLALGLYDDIEVSVAPDGVTVEVDGEGAGQVPCDDAHLVVRAMRTTWAITGDAPTGLRMRCRNAIPHSRGLGSSAAAAVGGAVAAVVLAGRDAELERDTILQVTAGMEGTRTTRPPACSAGSSSRGRRPGIPRSGSTLYGSTCTRTSVRSRSSREPSRSPAPRGGCCPIRSRWPTRPSPAAVPRSRCWPSRNAPSC